MKRAIVNKGLQTNQYLVNQVKLGATKWFYQICENVFISKSLQ